MKLLLISVYPPFPAPEANHALHLSEHLADAGVEVHVLCQKDSIAATQPGIVIHPLMESWSFGEISRVKEALSRSKPDAVLLVYLGWIYGQSAMMTVLPSIVKRFGNDVPFLTQFEAIEGEKIPQSWFWAFARRLLSSFAKEKFHARYGTLLSRSDVVLTLSRPHRDTLAKEYPGVVDKSVVLPPPPLIRMSAKDPLSVRKQMRTDFKLDDDQFVFLFWGHIYPGKGLDTLLFAFELVRKEIPEARLLIVGGPLSVSSTTDSSTYFQMVSDLPDKLGIADSVRWAGAFEWDSDKGSEYLRAADAFVLPLDWGATLNNSSLAAAATHGLPIIATKAPGEPDAALVHGQNLYFCPPLDPPALADAMIQLARDSSFRETLTAGSRSLAEKWHTWPPVIEKLQRLLESTITPRVAEARRPAKTNDLAPPASSDTADHPAVSVILAAYNVEKYLPQCLDSLVHQTFPGVEIIAIDDASTDNTRKILEQYAALYPNIRVVALEANVGLASVRNIGLRHARGTYVTFLDSDDWADVRMCEILHEAVHSVDADVVSASATVFYDNERKTFGPLFDHLTRDRISEFAKKYCFELTQEPAAFLLEQVAWSKIYKKSFLTENNISFEDGFNSYEDTCFHVKCMIKAKRIRVIDDPVVFYRQNRPGQISAMTDKRKFQIFDIYRIIHETAFAANVPDSIWAQIIRLELRYLDWLLKQRTADHEQRAFMRRIANCLRAIPDRAWKEVRYWDIREAAKSVAMRRGSVRAYRLTEVKSTLPSRLLCMSSLKALSSGLVQGHAHPNDRSLLPRPPKTTASPDGYLMHEEIPPSNPASLNNSLRVDVRRIRGQTILLCNSGTKTNVTDDVWRAEHDHFLTQLCIFRDHDIVVDIGAHVGISAILLAKMFPSIRIYAVEPDRQKFLQMKRNIELNGVENVHPINVAVAGFNGAAKLFSGRDGDWSTIDPRLALRKKSLVTQDIDVTTIGDLFRKQGISDCRMLKISAWGSVKDILTSIPPSITIDYLCGEVDREDCGLGTLEVASWRHSRYHFWREWRTTSDGPFWSTVIQLPSGPVRASDIGPKELPTSTRSRQKRVIKKGGSRPGRNLH